jgi:16S rRNA (uracil1498-N3)-methyltransferase
VARVLRLTKGDPMILFDGLGHEAQAMIEGIHLSVVHLTVGRPEQVQREAVQPVTVIQALCSGDKMDWVIEKATELGAQRLIPVAADRSLLKLSGDRAEKRLAHWRNIAKAAAAQCGRTIIPEVSAICRFEEAVRAWATHPLPKTGWLLDPDAQTPLSKAPIEGELSLLIGPEAGFSEAEEALARRLGLVGVRCGPRVLRTETAALAALAAIAARTGDF